MIFNIVHSSIQKKSRGTRGGLIGSVGTEEEASQIRDRRWGRAVVVFLSAWNACPGFGAFISESSGIGTHGLLLSPLQLGVIVNWIGSVLKEKII